MNIVTDKSGTTVVFADMDAGEVRRLNRIFQHAANGEGYKGELTQKFATAVRDAIAAK